MVRDITCSHCGATATIGDGKRLTCKSCHRPLATAAKGAPVARAVAAAPATAPHGVSRGYRKVCSICAADVTFTTRIKLPDGTYHCEVCDRVKERLPAHNYVGPSPHLTCVSCGAAMKSGRHAPICEACEAATNHPQRKTLGQGKKRETVPEPETRSAMRWIILGVAAVVLSIGIATWIILTPRWEESHLNEILSMRETAMQLYGANKPVESYHAFESLFAFVGNRSIKTPYVVDQLASAKSTMDQAYAKAKPIIDQEAAEARAQQAAAEAAARQKAADEAAAQERQKEEQAAQEQAAQELAQEEKARAELAAKQAIAKALFARSSEHANLQSAAKSVVTGLQTDLIGEDSAYRSISARAKATRALFAILVKLQGHLSGSNVNDRVDQIVNAVDRDLIGEDSAIRATHANDEASLKLLGVWCDILSKDFPSLPTEFDKIAAGADRDTAGDDSAVRAVDAYSSAVMGALRLISSSICGPDGPDSVIRDVSVAQIGEDSAWRSAMKNCDGSMQLLLLILDHDGGDQAKPIRSETISAVVDDDSALRVQSQYRQGIVDAVAALIENR
jgi:hypothetical protein